MEAVPAVVVDAPDVCDNLDKAQAALQDALGGSMAPGPGWRLRVFDERRGSHIIVTANLDDAQGNAVAHREIDSTTSDRCAGVISALGIWAALVLDAEVSKAKAHPAAAAKQLPAARAPGEKPDPHELPRGTPLPMAAPDADAGTTPQHTGKALEIGASGVLTSSPLQTGPGVDSALVGGDVFLLIELARSFFLRPALDAQALIGGPSGGYYATRLDACLRIPGNYTEHRGLLLDACAGTELGAFDHALGGVHATDVIFQIGPTIGLRGDLASDLAVEVRGLAGFNVVHSGDQIGLLALRAELGFTWRIR